MVHVWLPSTGEVIFLVFARLENKKQFCLVSHIIKNIIHGLFMIRINNRPFPCSPRPLFQNEGRCSAFDMEIIFHSHANKTHFHKKACALNLILKKRVLELRSGLFNCSSHDSSFCLYFYQGSFILWLDFQYKLQWTPVFDHWNLVEGIGHGCVIDCNISYTHWIEEYHTPYSHHCLMKTSSTWMGKIMAYHRNHFNQTH